MTWTETERIETNEPAFQLAPEPEPTELTAIQTIRAHAIEQAVAWHQSKFGPVSARTLFETANAITEYVLGGYEPEEDRVPGDEQGESFGPDEPAAS